ncbi:MAG: GIY-YIG nuclease family protein [Bacteriovoracaceae bacterium]|nr:GIY-YIG nuclease family protein [Bacteriovoracaceae bacterium]
MVKIGKTKRDTELRAKELSRPTGVPGNFIVAYEVETEHYSELEKLIHKKLKPLRHSTKKEFFEIPLKAAISELQTLHISLKTSDKSKIDIEKMEILSRLKVKYSKELRQEVVAVYLLQTMDRCYLEVTTEEILAGYLKNQKIHRMDLGFISYGQHRRMFDPNRATLEDNANIFIDEFDPYSIVNCTDLFHEEAAKEIFEKHNKSNEDF